MKQITRNIGRAMGSIGRLTGNKSKDGRSKRADEVDVAMDISGSKPADDGVPGTPLAPVPPSERMQVDPPNPPNPEDVKAQAAAAQDPVDAAARATKRMVIHNNPEMFDTASDTPAPSVPKDEATKSLLLSALKDHFLFAALEESSLNSCIDVMAPVTVAAGDDIIRQGDTGSEFYVLDSGEADALVNDAKVTSYVSGASFGELALMYNCERAATIKATTGCKLWSMGLKTFRQLLATTAAGQTFGRCEFLRRVPLLEPLNNDQITKLADALEQVHFKEGEYIIRQGEQGQTFYLIESGTVKCTQWKSINDRSEVLLLTLHDGDYFGEMALMLEEPRAANCVAADGDVRCLALDRQKFFTLLGPIQELLQNNMRLRILRSVPLLSKLTDLELCRVADALCVQSFEDGDYIIRQGEEGSRFYIINEGEVVATGNVPGTTEEKSIMTLSKGEFFGERALLKLEPRAANIVASGFVDCLVLERDDFVKLLGPLDSILDREIARRETVGGELLGVAPVKNKVDVNLEDLKQIKTLGTGTFGRVKLVQHRVTGEVYALKCMQKVQIAKSHQQRNILNEKNILMGCDHPMILNLICTFNTDNELLMLTELLLGGELWTYIYDRLKVIPRSKQGGFNNTAALFYAGCVTCALYYLHQMSIAYRDLKPENLLLAPDGYLKVIDFGFAKRIPFKKGSAIQTRSFTLCGTPDYLAPELVLSRGHDKSVDYWALGCFIYELLVGQTPFSDRRQAEIFKKAIRSDRFLVFPPGFDPVAEDLIRRLLTPNPVFRSSNVIR
ncbi:unnamed protein product [Chrysoparadoxa australica]